MTDAGWPQDHKSNGSVDHDLIENMEMMHQGKLLRDTILRLGRPAETHLSPFLAEGQMYIVDTSVATELYEAETEGRLLIVHHKDLEENAKSIKDTLNRALAEATDGI